MKALKLLILLLALTVLAACAQMSPVTAPIGIVNNDHEALVRHYENLAEEAKIKLQENKEILEAYEARSYYYGRQGLDLPSHASANIRAHEETLSKSLKYVEFHRKMAMEQRNNRINTAEIDPEDRDLTVENDEYSGNTEL
ncbi:hypothetical protein C8R34_11521 [Nitrosomonas sp. Nm84]|nr:hypothetical protein C8R34_11521 [Nitrosomonas sp. Nm84]